ncbi:MAG: transposase, partial [Muribaculaceae bacterium]|nr:transposase [Muribaculaceae bacterium]
MKKARSCEDFGSIEGNARIAPGSPGCARIKESELGKIIAKALIHFPYQFHIIKLHQFCVMPDHVHILLQIRYRSDKHLDFYIDRLRENIAAGFSILSERTVNDEEIFIPGYCDKPLYDNRNLDGWYKYIRENPHRLAMRKQYPMFFRRVRNLKFGDYECQAYGNLFLLRNPDKIAVKISRSFSADERARKRDSWLSAVAQGTILVSPFISPAEKEIRSEAESLNAKIILITHEPFPERYKPAAHNFALCEEGRLLIISMAMP